MKFCPTCKRQGKVTDSRTHPTYTRRRYHCTDGHSWTTAEGLVAEGDSPGNRVHLFRLEQRLQLIDEFKQFLLHRVDKIQKAKERQNAEVRQG